MSSDIQSTLQFLVLNDYLALAAVTAVVYDSILTFSREVEYVWCRPWSWVSTMFVVIRYAGLYWIVIAALANSSFVPGPLEVGKFAYVSFYWAFVVFLSTTDLLMILRVYAIWNRSRAIICALLSLFIVQTLIAVVIDGIYINPNIYSLVTTVRILDFSLCSSSSSNPPRPDRVYYIVPRLALASILTVLAVLQTLKQAFEMYKATKQWRPNRYLQKLVKEGILYFVMNVLYQINNLIYTTSNTPLFLQAFLSVAFYTLIPRFVISIRELYDHDIRRGVHVDTGFGVRSRSNPSLDATVSAMAFADVDQGPEVESIRDNSSDVEMGRMHGSGLNEDSAIEGRE